MAIAKYDWDKIKKEYLASDIIEIQDFLATFLRLGSKTASNGFWKGKTKGWRTEKENFKKEQTEETKKKLINDVDVQEETAKLLQSKRAVMTLIRNKMAKEQDSLGSNDLKNFWQIIKVELGEPITIAQNDNKNTTTLVNQEELDKIIKALGVSE